MKKLLLCITLIFALQNTFAQPDGLIDEIFNLKYLEVNNNTYYTPNGANSSIIFVDDGSEYSMNANGILNVLFANVIFNDDTLTFENIGVKLTSRSYEDKEGEKRYITEVVVNDLLMLGK